MGCTVRLTSLAEREQRARELLRKVGLQASAFAVLREPIPALLEDIAQVAGGSMVFPYLDVTQLNASPLSRLDGE